MGNVDVGSHSIGYLEILQWALANGCPWNSNLVKFSTKRVAEWAVANGYSTTA